MKVKKDDSKDKKKKNRIQPVPGGIKKTKKTKKLKIEPNSEVGEVIKKEIAESQNSANKIPLKQAQWNSFLKAFLLHEKLNKKQRLMMEFCTNKGRTPPKRKTKFLNFIRNGYLHQADVTDDQVFELFDTILLKYLEFKSGNYHNVGKSDYEPPKPRLSKNRKKKNKIAEAKANSSSWTTAKTKKKKKVKENTMSEEKPEVSIKKEKNNSMELE